MCADSGYHANDRGRKPGVVKAENGSTDPMIVYSIKGVENNDYIYVRWVYDGFVYKRDVN